MQRLYDWLGRAAVQSPDKPAAVFASDGSSLTYAELDRQSDVLAGFFRGVGVGRGDRVALLGENTPRSLIAFWAALKAGAATVDVPGLASFATKRAVLDEARPKAIVAEPKFLAEGLTEHAADTVVSTDAASAGGIAWTDAMAPDASNGTATKQDCGSEPDDVALIVYTSGTTGRPNGVMLSHRNFVANLEASNELMGLSADDSILVVVPLYYIHGRMQLLLHTMLGATCVFSRGFAFPQKVLEELVEYRTTGFSGVPYHFKQLLKRSKLAATELPDLRYVLITGGALTPDELEQLQAAMPNTGIHLAYGQTEAAPRVTWMGPESLFGKRGSVGIALSNVTIEILDEHQRPLPAGQVGEVAVSGPNIMKGYVSGDEVELGKIDDAGRLRTGDLARFDGDGYLFLVGRSSEMIKSAGERIFPPEVEEVLERHSDVAEAAVIGVPDLTLGERLVAYVVPALGAEVDASALKTHCLQTLPFVRVPKAFEACTELPKTGSGKVDRGALRKRAAAAAGS